MKMKTLITCWNCDTTYNYQLHNNCPVCDRHFLDKKKREAGSRVSVVIDYTKEKLIPVL